MRIFSLSLKQQIKDCMLAVFWPKKQIFGFFKDCSVPAPVLKSIKQWDELSRAEMIDRVFARLSDQPDGGAMQFDIMLEMLSNWSHFDEFWFVTQQKLDLESAKKKIAALKSAKTGHIDIAREAAENRRIRAAEREARHKSIEDMRNDFYSVASDSTTPQKRGFAFERFLHKMARFYGLPVTESFKIKGTQIDGTIKYDGENYNIEAKWDNSIMSNEPLLAFCRTLDINMYGRGIFISVNGYSPGALHLLERSGVKNAVLMDGEDISLILSEHITLPDALEMKIHAAQTRGQFYIHPITGKSKIPVSAAQGSL